MCSYAEFYNANSIPPVASLACAGLARCAACGEYFPHNRCTALFCSDACRLKAYARRVAHRRLMHERRRRTFTCARSTREGFCVQGGVPRAVPRQLPTLKECSQ